MTCTEWFRTCKQKLFFRLKTVGNRSYNSCCFNPRSQSTIATCLVSPPTRPCRMRDPTTSHGPKMKHPLQCCHLNETSACTFHRTSRTRHFQTTSLHGWTRPLKICERSAIADEHWRPLCRTCTFSTKPTYSNCRPFSRATLSFLHLGVPQTTSPRALHGSARG